MNESKGIRIAKRVAESGVTSRREAERLIKAGRVKIDGALVDTPVQFVTDEQIITIDDEPIGKKSAKVVIWKFHKPRGVLTTKRDTQNRKTVFDCLPAVDQRLLYIGRLDYNTEGLLLFTNNGDVARKMELPKSNIQRVYRARIFGDLTQEKIDRLKRGITIDKVNYGSINVELERRQDKRKSANFWVRISLSEGKNREIRKAMERVGCSVSRLIRVSYGPITLGNLVPGEFVRLSEKEVRRVLEKIEPAIVS